MTLLVEENEAANPRNVRLFGSPAVVPDPDLVSDAIEKPRRPRRLFLIIHTAEAPSDHAGRQRFLQAVVDAVRPLRAQRFDRFEP